MIYYKKKNPDEVRHYEASSVLSNETETPKGKVIFNFAI